MKQNNIKNLCFICISMIFIHIAGFTYQLITHASVLAVTIKITYILFYLLLLILLKKSIKIAVPIGIFISCVITIISSMYMDFLSVIVALISIFYLLKLKRDH